MHPDGSQTEILAADQSLELRPNGIALLPDGSFLLANLGTRGGVWHLQRDGSIEPWLNAIDGERLPPCNFVMVDAAGRTWITVSTRREPRALGYRPDVDDGFIVMAHAGVARIAARGLGYTNEVQLHPSGDWLYVNETFGRRLSRFPVDRSGRLGRRETVIEFGHGVFPDGLAFDADGGIWITSLVSNRVIRIFEGRPELMIADSDAEHVQWVEAAFAAGTMDRPHLDTIKGVKLRNTSSIAFGGPALRTGHVGCLLDTRIAVFDAPVSGVPPVHWDWG